MLCYNFNGLEGFKARFGLVEHGNGEKSRKNKILLAYIKQPSLFKEASRTGDYSLINIASMSELKQTMLERVQQSGCNDESLPIKYNSSTIHSIPANTKPTSSTEFVKTVMSNVADIRIVTTAEHTK